MIYFQVNSTGRLAYIHYMPFDKKYGMGKAEAELLKTGYLVDSLPTYTGEIPEGKVPELRYDGIDFSWEMVDAPEPETTPSYEELKSELKTLKSQQAATDSAVLGLMNMLMNQQ